MQSPEHPSDTNAPRLPRKEELLRVLEELYGGFAEAEETLSAIRRGEVDAFLVSTDEGEKVYTLKTAEHPYRVLIEQMREGAAILSADGTILYSNTSFARLLRMPLEKVMGESIQAFIAPDGAERFRRMMEAGGPSGGTGESTLQANGGGRVPVYLSLKPMPMDGLQVFSLVALDLTERKRAEEALLRAYDELEDRVEERTSELAQSNASLQVEIEERKKMEDALRESEQSLAAELDATQRLQQVSMQLIQADRIEALFEQILDTAVTIMHADFASIQMLYPERGTAGELGLLGYRGFTKEAARFWEWVRPDSESSCGKALCTGQRVIVPDIQHCECLAGSADYETFLQTGIRAMQTTPLVSRSGILMGMLSTHWRQPHEPTVSELRSIDVLARQAADLIDRKRAEEALQKREERFRMLTENASDLVIVLDPAGNISYVSPSVKQIGGYTPEELVGRNGLDFVHPDDLPLVMDALQTAAAHPKERVTLEVRLRHASGDWLNFDVIGANLMEEAAVRGFVVNARNITERKRAEEERQRLLIQLEKRMHQLETTTGKLQTANEELETANEVMVIANEELRTVSENLGRLNQELEEAHHEANLYLDIMTHDVRNANNVSSMYADLLVELAGGDLKTYAQKLHDSIGRSSEILRNVDTIRKVRSESAGLVPMDLDAVIREEIGNFPGAAICYDGRRVDVLADGLLPGVFTNLIGNAVKFGGADVEIAIRVEERNGEILVMIADTGPGVPDETKERLFTRFERGMAKGRGEGLGLYIVRKLAERYGGTVWIEDRVPGHPEEGAAFRFTLRKAAPRK